MKKTVSEMLGEFLRRFVLLVLAIVVFVGFLRGRDVMGLLVFYIAVGVLIAVTWFIAIYLERRRGRGAEASDIQGSIERSTLGGRAS